MTARRRLSGLFVGAVVLLLPGICRAQGSCFTETVLIADGRIVNGSLAASATGWYLVQTAVGRSYSVEVKAYPNDFSTPVTITVFNGTSGCGPANTLVTRDTSALEPPIPANGRRRSFTAIDPANSGFHRVSVVNGNASPLNFTVTVSDTTLFSTAWSTNGSYDTFYSLYNTTASSISGTLTLINTAGTAVTTANLTVPAGRTLSTNTVALATVRGGAGTAKFTHDGPPGSILAEAAIANFSIVPTPYFQFVHFNTVREGSH